MELMKSLKTMEKEKNAVQENRNLQLLILKAMKDTIKSGDVDAFQEKIIDSITNKLMKLPEDTIVYPGHGKITMITDEQNIYLELQPKDF